MVLAEWYIEHNHELEMKPFQLKIYINHNAMILYL